jgi:hypothetical protein
MPHTETAPVTDTELSGAKSVAPYASFDDKAKELAVRAQAILALDPNDPKSAKQARETRLTIKPFRVAIEHRHAELKRSIIDEGRRIDNGKNTLLELLKPIEDQLLAIEKHAEIQAAAELAALKLSREDALRPFATPGVPVESFSLATLPQPEFDAFLADMKQAHADRLQRAAEAAEAALVAEQAKAAEDARIRAEHEAQQKLLAEQARQLAAERAEAAAREKAAKEKADAEAEVLRQERLKEQARAEVERQRVELAAQVERKKREAAEAELAAQRQRDAEAAAAKEAAEHAAAAAPDKEKLLALADTVAALPVPQFATANGKLCRLRVEQQLQKFSAWLRAEAGKL